LRSNPGGTLDQAIDVTNLFIERGLIVETRGRNQEYSQNLRANGKDILKGMPMVVLINKGSASAAEIVAGALHDHKRAILIGTKSFGKGSVQSVISIPGYGGMRLTTAYFFTPNGAVINGKGIEPDIVIENKDKNDPQGMDQNPFGSVINEGTNQTPLNPVQPNLGQPTLSQPTIAQQNIDIKDLQLEKAKETLYNLNRAKNR